MEVDIGEVDLIVNFDCLSSPIRTIQRVGRTGRKREGRVVTLVAEGHEERTYVRVVVLEMLSSVTHFIFFVHLLNEVLLDPYRTRKH